MVSTIPGSEILTSTLNMISQSLQIPVIIFLVVFAIFAVLAIGGLISEILRSSSLTQDSRHALAKKLIEFEENKFTKSIERTDVVTRIGPTLGLMGTLIPMGPGLAALGAGDVNTLANAIIVAFDTTVVGIGAGAVAYFVSKVRRRWYEEYLSNLDALADALLDKLNHMRF